MIGRILLLCVTAGILSAQELPPPSIKVDVALVNTAFTVQDASGTLIPSLSKEDFEVFEDGVPQEIRFFGRSSDLPLLLGLAVDVSTSQLKFLRQHRRDIEDFVRTSMSPRDRAAVLAFGNRLRLLSDFTASSPDLLGAVEDLRPESFRPKHPRQTSPVFPEIDPDVTRFYTSGSGTALFDAICAMAGKLASTGSQRKAIILFSDGMDNSSAHDLIDAIEAAQRADAVIYTVRYTEARNAILSARERYGKLEMERLAADTAGVAFDASKGHIGPLLTRISDELRSTYDLGYVTTNPARDGTFRKILVRAKRPGLTVRARPGYYAR